MPQINSKILACFLVSFLLIITAGTVGLVIGIRGREIIPDGKIILPSEFSKKPITEIRLSVEGNIKSISPSQIILESGGDTLAMGLDQRLKFYRLPRVTADQASTAEEQTKPLATQELSLSQVKKGDKVLVSATFRNNQLVVVSLAVVPK